MRVPKATESIDRIYKRNYTDYPLRDLGVGEVALTISEEERAANFHIIGQPRQGKSKFLEDQIRKDIDMGNGLCLLDPSENGDTAKKVLRYCAKKSIDKVVYIDPDVCSRLDRIPTLQPLKLPPFREQSIDALLESVNALFGIANQTDTNRIRRNFTAVLNLISQNNQTLYETKYFRNYTDPNELPFINIGEDSMIIKDAFSSRTHFNQHFITTVGRLDLFRANPIKLMTASNTGIDFSKMIREGWVILVNLSPNESLSKTQARLLGILMISEIIQAMSYLFKVGEEGSIKRVFYLYMDEAGRFATPQITDLLDYYGKMGLRFIIAHHDFSQFKDKDVLTAIKNSCRIKMMFNISSYKDRLEMVEDLGYGGDLHPLLASYANQNIPKQEVVIKKDKETPVRIKIPFVKDITRKEVPDEMLKEYTKYILSRDFYLTKDQIHSQINARTPTTRTPREDSQTTESRAKNDGETNRKPRVSNRKNVSSKWKDVS